MYGFLVFITFLLVFYLIYTIDLRPWIIHWGSTPEERAYRFPGYDQMIGPNVEITWGITINAPPQEIFPWIAQLGRGAGWYSYDKWTNGELLSADYIIPEIPPAQIGDKSSYGTITSVEPNDHIVWTAKKYAFLFSRLDITRTYSLLATKPNQTRLLVRERMTSIGFTDWFDLKGYETIDFIITRRQLLNLKDLIETYPRRLKAGLINQQKAQRRHQNSSWSHVA
jgi:hypothetical protein